ncbi:MAG: lipopolysaccharide biosynthesis protein [Saprospiraceae bacterium]|nr:lipopolysaccharide biosynthesis protein [Saprospiraceae bacterium]
MALPNLERQFKQGVRWSMIGSVGGTLFQFLQMLVFARLAGPEDAGDYALAATFIGVLTPMAEAGLSQAVVSSRTLNSRQFGALFRINFGICLAAIAGLFLTGSSIAAWYERPALAGLLPLMGMALLFTPLGAQYGALLSREMRFDDAAKIQVGSGGAGFLLVAFLAWNGWGPWAMAWGFVVRSALASLGCWWVARDVFSLSWKETSSWKELRPLLRFGLFDLSARWADFLANWLDKLIVGKWLGAATLGFYNLAFTIGTIPTARIGYVVTRVSFPLFAKAGDNMDLREQIFQKTTRNVVLILYPAYLTMFLFAEELIRLLYGANWQPAVPLLQAFGAAGLIRTLAAGFPQLTRGIGKPQWALLWLLLWAAAANAVLAVCLWINPAPETAAWSRVGAKLLLEIPLLAWLAQRCGVSFGGLLQHAWRYLIWLSPLSLAVYVAGEWLTDFWQGLFVKTLIWAAGLSWALWRGPLRNVKRMN